MSKTIREFVVPFDTALTNSPFPVNMPDGSRFVGAETQGDNLVVWLELDPFDPRHRSRLLHVLQTGRNVPDHASYISTVQLTTYDHRYVVLHLYDGGNPAVTTTVVVSENEKRGREWADRHGKKPACTPGGLWGWSSVTGPDGSEVHTLPTLLAAFTPLDFHPSESAAFEALGKGLGDLLDQAKRLTAAG